MLISIPDSDAEPIQLKKPLRLNKNSNQNVGGTKSPLTRNGGQKYLGHDPLKDGVGIDNDI
jgi:hypothetical protein